MDALVIVADYEMDVVGCLGQIFREQDEWSTNYSRLRRRIRKREKKIADLQAKLDGLGVWPEPLYLDVLFSQGAEFCHDEI